MLSRTHDPSAAAIRKAGVRTEGQLVDGAAPEPAAATISSSATGSKEKMTRYQALEAGALIRLPIKLTQQEKMRWREFEETLNEADQTRGARQMLRHCASFVFLRETTVRLWERGLNDGERCKLAKDMTQEMQPFEFVVNTFETAERMWSTLHGGTIASAVLNICRRLDMISASDYRWLMRACGDEYAADVNTVEELAVTRRVVVDERERKLYIDGDDQNDNDKWPDRVWQFIVALARTAQEGVVLTPERLRTGGRVNLHALHQAKSVTVKQVPDLQEFIECVTGKGYRLKVDPFSELAIVPAAHFE